MNFKTIILGWLISWLILDKDKRAYTWAVFLHETGNGTSELFKKYNNAFGMRVPSTRSYHSGSVQIGNIGTFAKFPTLWHSLKDFIARQSDFGNLAWKLSDVGTNYYQQLCKSHLEGKWSYLGNPPEGGEKARTAYMASLTKNQDAYQKVSAWLYILDVVLFGSLFYGLYALFRYTDLKRYNPFKFNSSISTNRKKNYKPRWRK